MFSRRRTHEVCPTSARARKFIPGFDQGVRSFERHQRRGSHRTGNYARWASHIALIHRTLTLPGVGGGFQRPPLLGPGKKEPTPGRVNNRAVPQIKRTCTPRTTLLNSHTYLASKQTHSIIIENAADQKNPALQHPLEANFHYTGRGLLQKERK